MKLTLIVMLALTFASCATRQPPGPYPPSGATATDQFDRPPFVGMSKAQIARLIWRTQ